MKKLILFPVIIFIIIALTHPAVTLEGATNGLMIWFNKLLPTLLPFFILLNVLWNAGIIFSLLEKFPGKKQTTAILLTAVTGLTFGLPVGAKMTADFQRSGLFTKKVSERLLVACNQLSPAFVGSFVLLSCLNQPRRILISYVILYLPGVILVMVTLLQNNHTLGKSHGNPVQSSDLYSIKKASRFQTLFQIIDAGIMNGFETITKLGGYLIMFGILCQYMKDLVSINDLWKGVFLMTTEITSGIYTFTSSQCDADIKYILCMSALSFGGLCTHAQTYSVISDTKISKVSYFVGKIISAVNTCLLSILAVRLGY